MATMKTVATILAALLVYGVLAFYAGRWTLPADPRAPRWLAVEAFYRARLKAFDRDTTIAWEQVRIARAVNARTFFEGKRLATSVLARLDSLSIIDTPKVRDCPRVFDLRPLADNLRLAVMMYDSAHSADSTTIAAQRRIIVTMEDRLRTADSLIAEARPIIADARRRSRWGLGVTAGYGCGQRCGPQVTAGLTFKF